LLLHSHSIPSIFITRLRPPPTPTLFPYTTLFRSPSLPEHLTPAPALPALPHPDPPVPALSQSYLSGEPAPVSSLPAPLPASPSRSEEHTSELQSRENLVCRLLLEKKNTTH